MHPTDDTCREWSLPDEVATLALGAALAQGLMQLAVTGNTPGRPKCFLAPWGEDEAQRSLRGGIIYLEGDLGAGKTTLVRGLLRKVGFGGTAKSPTYTLVEPYVVSGLNLYHFDFYRFNTPEEFLDAGLDEYFAEDAVCLVEWPDRAAPYLPAADLRIRLLHDGPGRHASIESGSERGQQWLSALPTSLAATSSALLPPA
ncbi:MAG: tRNA (adenosine(37)-N6)-threonylcarbamoyltransferase complex ATPase subunit type 1 TsaE [Gammaproteobacteria bacterium]|nr:tRNA (adenosine(37)-N6)-threonylcarbamoyltransferase complex ATPase subunit type 1 TsaE [Rhodocyclaceae bacterium]MBU3910437.1 tRNA (adenosine(37)-N6)-threonylcarbamoyltransferase complex ATPase subunit type 1 TsaE [Gammaproteobacteria bacterium]MBU3989049.1 tRNA (adenosine(37)-N6)-threonylcarbamoyltransferase complex ATPase subunit type 1 TsaE [Gammaproteobacteria bacterium]MBU4004918.1 tRNA (adenosine(37)-N6)-threonylcarbamoyltransferase complex ATPase subunit type 1 TsaE [Gammaproteobacter